MRAPHAAKAFIKSRLHTKGKAVHACGKKAVQQGRRQRFRVSLQRNLCPGSGLCCINQLCKLGRAQQAGRTSAEIQGVRRARKLPAQAGQLAQQGVHIFPRNGGAAAQRVKIAVSAFGKTVGNVKIDALHGAPPFCLCGAGRFFCMPGRAAETHDVKIVP